MKFTAALWVCIAQIAIVGALDRRAQCHNNCGRAVVATRSGSTGLAVRSSDCMAYLLGSATTTIVPTLTVTSDIQTSVVTIFVTTTTGTTTLPPATTYTYGAAKRNAAIERRDSTIPVYASACSTAGAYSNACACLGVYPSTTTTTIVLTTPTSYVTTLTTTTSTIDVVSTVVPAPIELPAICGEAGYPSNAGIGANFDANFNLDLAGCKAFCMSEGSCLSSGWYPDPNDPDIPNSAGVCRLFSIPVAQSSDHNPGGYYTFDDKACP